MNATMRLALLLGILVVGCANAACPPGFVASTTIPGKCYYIETTRNDLFWAVRYCRNLIYGADILSIANGFENSEVASLLQPQGISDAFAGIVVYDNKSHWIATAAGSSNYSNLESNALNGRAALITPSGGWDYTDRGISYSICQIYPDDPTTFPPPQITCPYGWIPSISARGKCYLNIDEFDFFSATRECLTTRIGDSHAELLTLTSQLEMMELYWALPVGIRASLTKWETDDHWRWVETLHPTDYFGPYGQPENVWDYVGTCAYLSNSHLYGGSCWELAYAICQYFPDEPPAPTPPSFICPQNGTASITKPGTCYYFLGQQQSFQSARNACQALNNGFDYNDLFVPRTAVEYEEFEAILDTPNTYFPVWLGLTNSNGTWGWISGRSSNITDMWCYGQPGTSQNPNDRCGYVVPIDRVGYQMCWTAGDCTDSRVAICQSSNTF